MQKALQKLRMKMGNDLKGSKYFNHDISEESRNHRNEYH
jgi:hypothetical protein